MPIHTLNRRQRLEILSSGLREKINIVSPFSSVSLARVHDIQLLSVNASLGRDR